jgi:hypothetical protein
MTLKWKCTDKGCYITTQLSDWAMLNGCFKDENGKDSGVSVMDVDGIVHQNGRCLFLDPKHPLKGISDVQIRTINSLVQQGNSFIILWCTRPDGSDTSQMRVWNIPGYDSTKKMATDLEGLRKAVKAWWGSVYVPGKK